MGPCALEYTKLKTADHYWTDPSADELVQRHRIRGPANRQDSPAKRPALGVSILLPTSVFTSSDYTYEPPGSSHPRELSVYTRTCINASSPCLLLIREQRVAKSQLERAIVHGSLKILQPLDDRLARVGPEPCLFLADPEAPL